MRKNSLKVQDEHKVLFNKGAKTSFLLLFLSFAFFILWFIGYEKERLIVSNSSFFSKVFFFFNPHLFKKFFINGELLSYLKGAVNLDSFLFVWIYFWSVVIFFAIFVLAVYLFSISYKTCIKPFHFISCCSLFPIVSFFLIVIPIFKLAVFKLEMRFKYRSRFESMFAPEEFLDPVLGDFSEEDLYDRPITKSFKRVHYEKFFNPKDSHFLRNISSKLDRYLS